MSQPCLHAGVAFDLLLTDQAWEQLHRLQSDKGLGKRYKAVKKAIRFSFRKSRDIRGSRLMNIRA